MKRGRKANPDWVNTALHRMKAIGRLAMCFQYGKLIFPNTQVSITDYKNLRAKSRQIIGKLLGSFSENVIYHRGKESHEKTDPTPWKTLCKFHENLPHKLIKIGLAKNIRDAENQYNEGVISADNAAKKLNRHEVKPSALDVFYTLLKLKVPPEKVWPDELKEDRHLISLLAAFQSLFVNRQSIQLDANSVLRLVIIGKSDFSTAKSEIGKDIEKLLRSFVFMMAESNNGIDRLYNDLVDPKTGMAIISPHPRIAIAFVEEDGKKRKITWEELESILKD